jgi:hypothetical protein
VRSSPDSQNQNQTPVLSLTGRPKLVAGSFSCAFLVCSPLVGGSGGMAVLLPPHLVPQGQVLHLNTAVSAQVLSTPGSVGARPGPPMPKHPRQRPDRQTPSLSTQHGGTHVGTC